MLSWRSVVVLLALTRLHVPPCNGAELEDALEPTGDEFETPRSRPSRLSAKEDSPAVSSGRAWTSYRTVVCVNLGLGSAIGLAGATGSFWPSPYFGTELGLGIGVTGTQFSLMQKLAVGDPSRNIRFLVAGGVAYATGSRSTTGSIVWLNLDLAGLEIRRRQHFVFFLAGGLMVGLSGGRLDAPGLNPSESDCSPYPDGMRAYWSKVPGFVAPQGRVGMGAWF